MFNLIRASFNLSNTFVEWICDYLNKNLQVNLIMDRRAAVVETSNAKTVIVSTSTLMTYQGELGRPVIPLYSDDIPRRVGETGNTPLLWWHTKASWADR